MKVNSSKKVRRIISLLLTMVIMFSMITIGIPVSSASRDIADLASDVDVSDVGATPLTAQIDTGESVTISDLDENGFYEIGNADELYAFSYLVAMGNTTIKGELVADIVVNEGKMDENSSDARVWYPIGYKSDYSSTTIFQGILEGNSHFVSGLYHLHTTKSYKGLVARVGTSGIVRNVTVKNSYIHGDDSVGAVVGYSQGEITNCHSIDNIVKGDVANEAKYVGGVVGYTLDAATVTGCTNTGPVYGHSYVGGIAGYHTDGSVMTDCHNSGHIYGYTTDCGGVAGHVLDNGTTVTDCTNSGMVEGVKSVGGIAGYNNGMVLNSKNTADVIGTASTTTYVGGVVGYSSYQVKYCSNTGNVTGPERVGGVVAYNVGSSAYVFNCYNLGNVTSTTYTGGVVGHNYNGADVANCYNAGAVSEGNGTYIGGVVGRNNSSSPVYLNCYYLEGTAAGGVNGADAAGKAESRTAEQFASGEVAYLLQGSQTTDVWGQTIGEDSFPQLNDDKVYLRGLNCADDPVQVYSNIPNAPDHNLENGFCSYCGLTEPALDTDGDGYYEIDNAGKLYWFANQVDAGNKDWNAILTADITVNEGTITADSTDARVWNPIGTATSVIYAGTFDGNGKSISGLYYSGTAAYTALFANISSAATVKDVHLKNSYISGANFTAGIVGLNSGNVSGCTNEAVIIGRENAAGVVGYNKGTVTGCGNLADISSTGQYVGGIVGYSNSKVYESYNTGAISSTSSYVGGVVGYNTGSGALVNNCYNTGTVHAYTYSGGIVGYNTSAANIKNCLNTGKVTLDSGSYIGAITGRCYSSNPNYTNCYYLEGSASASCGNTVSASTSYVVNAEQLASGEITLKLQGTQTGDIWGQTLGEDPIPHIYDDKVYLKGVQCAGDPVKVYSNDPSTPDHNFINGFCTVCGGFEPALDTDGDYYYEIDNAGKLYWFAAEVNSGNTAISAILTKDIVINQGDITAESTDARQWTAIGNDDTPFMGHFNGNNKTISGMYHNSTETNAGLVGNLNAGAYISYVHITNSYIKAKANSGFIAGDNYATIECCSVTDSVIEGTGNYIGGIAGYSSTAGCIVECYNGSRVSGAQYVGGIAGDNQGGADIYNCYNTGDISSTSGYCAGITGYTTSETGQVHNCYSTGKVTGSTSYDGAIVGRNGGEVLNCYFLEGAHAGGIDGKNTAGKAEPKTAEEFASGVIAYLLQGTQEKEVWGQTMGEDPFPLLYDDKVYLKGVLCPGDTNKIYSNNPETPDHNYVNGFCTICDGYEVPLDTDEDGYYEIDNGGKLCWFGSQVDAGNTNYNAILTADIFVNEGTITADSTDAREFNSIGNSDAPFAGDFNGNGKTISGIYYVGAASTSYKGLFASIAAGGIVHDLTLDNSYIEGGSYIGGISGHNAGTVTRCVNYATVVNTTTRSGGIVGFNEKGVVSECVNYGTISGVVQAGGIVGINHSAGATVTNCYNLGDISTTGNYCGGVVAYTYTDSTVTNCYNMGTVTGGASYQGAITGRNNGGTITNCYYLDTSHKGGINSAASAGKAEVKNAEQFASGEVAYILQGEQETEVWGQKIGEDPIPTFNEHKVYYSDVNCADDAPIGYTNYATKPDHTFIPTVTPPTDKSYGYTTHVCSVCSKTYVDSYVRPLNVSGDFFIFDEVSTKPYLKVFADSYDFESPVYVKAGNGSWIGVYPASVTEPANKEDAIYTINIEDLNGNVFDLRTGTYNASNTSSTPVSFIGGEIYNVFLFSDEGFTVAASDTFSVNANIAVNNDYTNTYLQTNKKNYTFGESIMLKADSDYKGSDGKKLAYAAFYPKGCDHKTTPTVATVHIGADYQTTYGGGYVDVASSSVINVGALIPVGEYDVVLYSEKNILNAFVLAQISITVSYGHIQTNKSEYGYGEGIIVTAQNYDPSKISIENTFKTSAEVTLRDAPNADGKSLATISSGKVVTALKKTTQEELDSNWVYIEYNGQTGYIAPYVEPVAGSDLVVNGYLTADRKMYSSNSTSSTSYGTFPAGTAFTLLDTTSKTWIYVKLGGHTGYLNRSDASDTAKFKLVYEVCEPELPVLDSDARVELFESSVTPDASAVSGGSYKTADYPASVLFQSLVTNPVKAGEQTFYLFGDGSYNALDSATVTVSENITGRFSRGAYYVEKLSDGFANGRVMFELAEDSYGYIGSGAYASVYWVDADGNPLEGFSSFAKLPINNSILTLDMAPYSIIPEGAKGIKAYIGYNGKDSNLGLYISLPEGCRTYDGLDNESYDEFQIVADTKVGNETNTFYDDHYVNALTDIANTSGSKSLGIFIAGDSTNDGLAEQFASLNTYREQVAASTGNTVPPVYVSHGNTDDRHGMNQYYDFVNGYGAGVSDEKPYYSMIIGGYKFIFLVNDGDDKQISTTQIEWLDSELLDNEQNGGGKPAFILSHRPIEGTSIPGTGTVTNVEEISAVLSKYDDVIVWSGNMLAALTSDGGIYGGDENLPISVNVGAVARTRRYVDGVSQGYDDNTSDGLYVRVYEDKIVLMGRNFLTGEWIPESYCVLYNNDVSLPEKFPLIYSFTANRDDFLTNEYGRKVTFTSSEPTIATIDKITGEVTTVNYGHTIITAFAEATNTEVITRAKMDLRVKKPYDPGDPSDTNLLGINGDFETGVNMLHAEDPDFVSHTLTLYKGTHEFILKNVEYDFLEGKDITIVDKTDSNGFVIEEESDERFTLEASGGVYTFTFDEDTLIFTIDADLFEPEQESTFELVGLDGNFDSGLTMIHQEDTDVISTTVELYKGEYNFKLKNYNGDDLISSNTVIKDTVTGQIMNSEDACTLMASGGTYTFDYCLSKNELSVSFVPANIQENGKKTATIYVDYKDSDFTSTPYIYIWDPDVDTVLNNIGPLTPGQLLSGPNSEGYYYRTFKYDTSYQFVISDGEYVKTADSIVYDQEEVYVYFTEGTDYVTEKDPWFWIDLTPNDPSDPIDRLYPELVGMDGTYPLYCFYLPAGVDAKKLRLYGDEGANMKVSFVPVTVDGTKTVNVSGGVNKATKYNITDANNKTFAKLTVKQSGEIPAMYIQSDMIMPIGTGYEAAHKNGYSSAGTIKMINGASTVLYDGLEFTDLSITAGDTPSTDIIGKYSYDLTLKEETPLTSGGGKTYSLVSYDADEARLRNMTAIDLANAMGLKDAVSCQPVEVYNNGVYMGSYLLIERVETSALTLEFTTGNENSFKSLMGQDITCITDGVTADQLTELEAKWAEAEAVIYEPSSTYEELSAVIDVESFAKVYLLQELTKGINAGADNYYVYYENGKFTAAFTPEYDNTLGQMLPTELTDPEGWWAKNKEIAGEGIPNAQAALCDNPVFWNCVKAEWIEVFYDAASAMVPTEATYTVSTKKVTGQSGTYAEYYTLMNKSGNMDDAKWGICTNDALASEGTYDTGDTYDYAFISLNNYIYQRINWMDEELSKGYTLAEPTLTTKKPVYAVNEEIELKAEITSSGNLKYEFYNSKGELVYEETTDKGYVIYKTSFTDEGEETFKVVISSKRAQKPVEATVTVAAEYFHFILDVEAPKKVPAGSLIDINITANVDTPVEYVLTDKAGNFINSNGEGLFEIITNADDEAGLLEYVVSATTTVDGVTYTTSENIIIELIQFELSVDLTAPEKVEAGLDIDLIAKATVNDDAAIKYTFYNAEDMTLLGSNYTGAYIFSTDGLEAGAQIKFIVEAECEAYGNVYTAKSDIITVEVEAVTDVFNVTVYFKSTSTYGYKPLISTTGTVKDVENEEMQKDIFICKNATETASYFWYKTEFSVSRKSPTAFIRILSSRYAMEVQTNLMINEDATYYFATDNLNDGTVLYDLTSASEDERNWCESAVHMVYDPKVDGEEALAEVSARVDLRLVGDTTADGKMNIRDATYIQKGLAGIIVMSKTDMEVADVDDDLKVSIKDATCIQKKLAGIRN